MAMARAAASPSTGPSPGAKCPPCQRLSASIAMRCAVFHAMDCALVAAGAANTTSRSTGTGDSVPHASATMPPSEPPVTSASRSTPEVLQQRHVRARHVLRREGGERRAVGVGGAGRAVAAAREVGRDDGVTTGVERGARPKQRPPPGIDVGTAGEGVEDEDPAVARGGRRVPEDAVAKPRVAQHLAARGAKIAQREPLTGGGERLAGFGHGVHSARITGRWRRTAPSPR